MSLDLSELHSVAEQFGVDKLLPRGASRAVGALRYAEGHGWRVDVRHNGHVWGRIFCPLPKRSGCQMSVRSTPKNAGNEAKRIRRFVDNCPC